MRIATFNVRGLSSHTVKQNLITDAIRYNCDVICLQETKSKATDTTIDNHQIILFDTKCRHYGLGFVISPRLKKSLHKIWSVNDRIAVARFCTNKTNITIINVYGPTSSITNNDTKQRDQLFATLDTLVKEFKNDHLYLAGDFNAKVGAKQHYTEKCLGSHSKGKRNDNGQALVEFCTQHNLFITNSSFKHKACHITTWQGQYKDPSTNKIHPIYNQIDYILTHYRNKHSLTDARSYAGTLVSSDHRIVITSTDLNQHRNTRRSKPEINVKLDTEKLQDPNIKHTFQKECNKLLELNSAQSVTPKEKQTMITNIINDAARKTLPTVEGPPRCIPCPKIKELSEEQKRLRLLISNCDNQNKKADLKHQRNKIQHQIRHCALENASKRIDKIAEDIETTPVGHKTFKAIKVMQRGQRKPIVIHDEQGRRVEDDNEKCKRIGDHMKKKYDGPNYIEPFESKESSSLLFPITPREVKEAIKKLNNNRAPGPDKIQGEFLKAAPPTIIEEITDMFNSMFEKSSPLELGTGDLILLQKPNKPLGPINSLRPIVLLTALRKVLSLITLNRISHKVEHYLSASQSGFRTDRSTSDIVFAHKWMVGRIEHYKEEFTILGIDMSSAFDTIDRGKLLSILTTFLNQDDLKLIRVLLADTSLIVKTGEASDTIPTIIGTPQGDSLSPILFTVYLEGALRNLRPLLALTPTLPNELAYADDVDFLFTSKEVAESSLSTIISSLACWNLQVNAGKTEYTCVSKEQEDWKSTRKLGSLLGDKEDIDKRKILAIAAFKRMHSIFIRRNKISEGRRIRLYNAIVLPVLLYNCSTWSLTEKELNSINAFHRKQLRILLGIFYPEKISNSDLYERCTAEPISKFVTKQRWQLFGHILRRCENIPAQQAMESYFRPGNKYRGRPTTTLPVVLNKDIDTIKDRLPKEVIAFDHTYAHTTLPTSCTKLQTKSDLLGIRNIANNRVLWQELGSILVERREAKYATPQN